MNVQKINKNLNTKEKCKMANIISLESLIDTYKNDYNECFIWFNNELIEFKRFIDCHKTMDITKVFTENENYYILEESGIYHTVSTSNTEDNWEQ